MKWMTLVLAAMLAVTLVGCGEDKKDKDKDKGTAKGSGDKELTLTPPGETTITQGKKEDVTVKITRKDFDEDVTVSFSDLPKGVSVLDTDMKIEKGKTDKKFSLEAKDDATEGTHTAKVSAKGGGMEVKNREFKIIVKKK